MNPQDIFINPQTRLLRSGWRAFVFLALLFLPYTVLSLLFGGGQPTAEPRLEISAGMVASYVIMVAWVVVVSWSCLRFLERLGLAALGFAFHQGWWRDVLKGCAVGFVMIVAIVALQALGGGTRVALNPVLWEPGGEWNWTGVRIVAGAVSATLALFVIAGAFEELLFRGYAFQTLLRGAPAVVPLLLLSLFFGLAHWSNPSRTVFSTVNTALAGLWLAVGYLKTRNLWFPTALHFSWNWTMGAFFGLPVSGLATGPSVLAATSGAPVWWTGGSYGCEGGAAATLVLLVAMALMWRTRWLRVAPEMEAALAPRPVLVEEPLRLGLQPEE